MRFKEFFRTSLPFVSNLGTNKFKITNDKENLKTPHYVMGRVLEMLENRPSITSGLKQYTRFLLNDIVFTSADEKSVLFATEWFEQRKNLKNEIFNWAFLLNGCGTSYFEPTYINGKNGKILDNLFTVPDPSTVYKNLSTTTDKDYWIIELPLEVRQFKGQKLKYWPIHYVHGSFLFRKLVWGTSMDRNELVQYKIGWSRTNDYGFGLLSPAVDNEDTQQEILKNWALIAKYRSLSKKIIGFYNDSGESVDMSELDNIKEQFDEMEEEDSLLINKKFVSEDLTFNGTDNMMSDEMQYLQKDTGSSMVPNFMTAFSQDSSMATAAEAKVPFALELKSVQQTLKDYLNDVMVDQLKKAYTWLADDLSIELKESNLYSRNEEFMNYNQLYNMRAATFNELRKAAGASVVEGGDVWGQEPPLDKVKNEPIQLQEAFKKRQEMLKGLKDIPTKPKKIKRDVPIVEFKNKREKKVAFKEAVRNILK